MTLIKKPLLAIILLCVCGACKIFDQARSERKTFLSINGHKVDSDEFIYTFNKNNLKGSTPSEQEIDEYFNLFLNFKLKVAEARSLGYHNTAGFINEFQLYREELAKPFLTENQVSEKLVRQAYERMNEEVNASHILIIADKNTSPEDTLKALDKINELKQRALDGEDFNKLAAEHSQDPSAKANNGNLGYFTALQMVYPFEEKAYNTSPGTISPVFRTRFGYHILKVHDRRPSKGQIKASHILVRATEGISAKDSLAASRKIHEIYNKLQQGALWFDMCQQFSDDLSTKATGGVLPWFSSGKINPEFEDAAFALDEIGQMSKPVKTAYGWHIIKLEDRKGLEPYDAIHEQLKNLVGRDERSELSKKAFIERLKEENDFKENKKVAAVFADPEKLLEESPESSFKPGMEIFRIKTTRFYLEDFIQYIKETTGTLALSEQQLGEIYGNFVGEKLLDYEKEQLADKHYDYKMLLTEYEEGILLFQLMDERVWSRALKDTAGLHDFFIRNIDKYHWGKRLDAVVYNAYNESIRNEVKTLLEKEFVEIPSAKKVIGFNNDETSLSADNKNILKELAEMVQKNQDRSINLSLNPSKPNLHRMDSIMNYLEDFGVHKERIITTHDDQVRQDEMVLSLIEYSRKALEGRFNNNSGLNLKVEAGWFEKGDNNIVDLTSWQEGLYELNAGNRYYLIEVRNVLPPAPKNLEDIKGIVISDYQDFLEKEWIKELKAKYPVIINEKERKHIYRKLKAI